MNVTLTDDQIRIIKIELDLIARRYCAMAFGDLENYYLERCDQIREIIDILEKRA